MKSKTVYMKDAQNWEHDHLHGHGDQQCAVAAQKHKECQKVTRQR